jgi:hypothetical protein
MKLRQNLTKMIRKVVAYVDFSAPIIHGFEYFEHRFTYETDNYTVIARDFCKSLAKVQTSITPNGLGSDHGCLALVSRLS